MFGDRDDIVLTSYNWERFVRPLLRWGDETDLHWPKHT